MKEDLAINWMQLEQISQGETAEIKMSHIIYLVMDKETVEGFIDIYLQEGFYSEVARVFMSTFESAHLCRHIIERMDRSREDVIPLALLLKNWSPPHLPLDIVLQWLTDPRERFQWAGTLILSAWVTSSTIQCSQQQWQRWASMPSKKSVRSYMLKTWEELNR